MTEKMRACLVYVTATGHLRQQVRGQLEKTGYTVCEVKADLNDALTAQAGGQALHPEIAECIEQSDVCVFLLPEERSDDEGVETAAGFGQGLGKRLIVVVSGGRIEYPTVFEDSAHSVLRYGSDRLDIAMAGTEVWEKPDGSLVGDRTIRHVKCQ